MVTIFLIHQNAVWHGSAATEHMLTSGSQFPRKVKVTNTSSHIDRARQQNDGIILPIQNSLSSTLASHCLNLRSLDWTLSTVMTISRDTDTCRPGASLILTDRSHSIISAVYLELLGESMAPWVHVRIWVDGAFAPGAAKQEYSTSNN